MLARERERESVCVCVLPTTTKSLLASYLLGSTNTKDKRGGGGRGRGPTMLQTKDLFSLIPKSAAAHTALVFCRQHTKESHQAF
jgi:hypothetical protein